MDATAFSLLLLIGAVFVMRNEAAEEQPALSLKRFCGLAESRRKALLECFQKEAANIVAKISQPMQPFADEICKKADPELPDKVKGLLKEDETQQAIFKCLQAVP
ncbi:uncharacterized protein LOC144099973 [Amblyomma americanum]